MEFSGEIPTNESIIRNKKEQPTEGYGLMGVDEFFKKMGMKYPEVYDYQGVIYDNYATAMERRNRVPLSEESFRHHFFEGGSYDEPVIFGDKNNGCILGCKIKGVFVPSHFAPTSFMGGGRLIRNLLKSDIPTALFITEDLKKTIMKMKGWKALPVNIKTEFRGEEVNKVMVVNKWEAVSKLIGYQADKMFKDLRYSVRDKLENYRKLLKFGKRVKETSCDFYIADDDESLLN